MRACTGPVALAIDTSTRLSVVTDDGKHRLLSVFDPTDCHQSQGARVAQDASEPQALLRRAQDQSRRAHGQATKPEILRVNSHDLCIECVFGGICGGIWSKG